MGIEIERKFLLKNEDWKKKVEKSTIIKQGYLNTTPERTVRVRIKDQHAFLTIKGKNVQSARKEFEYEIPIDDAIDMIEICEKPIIEKRRYEVEWKDGKCWEIDVFEGENKGLIVAECELHNEHEEIDIPPWVGSEVTSDKRYYNSNLILHPFTNWEKT